MYYRPIFLLWFRLVYLTLGAPGSIWHLSSILAHLVVTSCVFVFIRHLTGDLKGAALASTLFAIHPIQTEAVAWISSSGDLLLTGFLVLCVYCYAERKGPISWLSLLFAALAMFTKEPGIVAPALIIAYEWTQSRFKNALVNAAPYALPALAYIALRANALGGFVSGAPPLISVAAMVLTWPRILALYFRNLAWPVHLSPCYAIPIEKAYWPALLLISVLAGLLWLLWGSCANIRFGAAWFALTLVPSLAIRYISSDNYGQDRYLYLPSVGLALIAAVQFGKTRFTFPRTVAACVVALALCWSTRLNLRIWQDDVSLFSRAVETAPTYPGTINNLASAYLVAHRESEAFPLLRQLITQHPEYCLAYYNMARYYRQTGDNQTANYYHSLFSRLNAR